MLIYLLKITVRSLSRVSRQIIISVLSLAFAFACFVFALYWFGYELTYDSFYPDSDRIYMVNRYYKKRSSWGKASQLYLSSTLKSAFPEIQDALLLTRGSIKVLIDKAGMEYASVNNLMVDTAFFRLFSQRFIHGGVDEAFKAGKGIILTESLSKQIFGTATPDHSYDNLLITISGVVADPPQNTSIQFGALSGWDVSGESSHSWGNSSYFTYIKLYLSASREKLADKLWNSYLSDELRELEQDLNLAYINPAKVIKENN